MIKKVQEQDTTFTFSRGQLKKAILHLKTAIVRIFFCLTVHENEIDSNVNSKNSVKLHLVFSIYLALVWFCIGIIDNVRFKNIEASFEVICHATFVVA